MTSKDRVTELSAAVERLERRVQRARWSLMAIIGMTISVQLLHVMTKPRIAEAGTDATLAPDSVLTIRELVVVDAMGTPRVRIGAPLPDPIMLGKRFNRGGVVSGILIYDAEGNERGGYVTGDESRGAAITLDEIMRAAVHIGVEDRGEAHVSVDNGLGGYGLLGINQRDGAYIRLHSEGRLTGVLPDTAKAGTTR
jgi:hypothetical protein